MDTYEHGDFGLLRLGETSEGQRHRSINIDIRVADEEQLPIRHN